MTNISELRGYALVFTHFNFSDVCLSPKLVAIKNNRHKKLRTFVIVKKKQFQQLKSKRFDAAVKQISFKVYNLFIELLKTILIELSKSCLSKDSLFNLFAYRIFLEISHKFLSLPCKLCGVVHIRLDSHGRRNHKQVVIRRSHHTCNIFEGRHNRPSCHLSI